MMGLIHECQIKGNKMESGLDDQRDLVEMNEEWHKVKKELKELKKQKKDLESIVGKMKTDEV